MKYFLPVFMVVSFLGACNNQTTEKNEPVAARAADSLSSQDFFPVPDYIGGQLTVIIDSLRLPLSKTVTIGGKPVLSGATDAELRCWAQNFRQPDISDPSIKKSYTATSIADQSIPSVTLLYTTADTSLPLAKMEVYVKPDPVNNDKVTGVYIEKRFVKDDTLFNQKLYWKTDKNMQVFTEKKIKGKLLPLEQIRIAWDPSE